MTQEALDQARGLFKRKMEGAAREVADLAQRVAVAAGWVQVLTVDILFQLLRSPSILVSCTQMGFWGLL